MNKVRFAVMVAQLTMIFAGYVALLGLVTNVQTFGKPWHNTSPRYGNELCFGVEDSAACYRLTWHGIVPRYSHPD